MYLTVTNIHVQQYIAIEEANGKYNTFTIE